MSGRKKIKKNVGPATIHLLIIGVILILQIAGAIILAGFLQGNVWWVTLLWYVVAFFAGFYVNFHHDNPSTKFFWILLIFLFPAFGLLIYTVWGLPHRSKKKQTLLKKSAEAARSALFLYSERQSTPMSFDPNPVEDAFPSIRNVSHYLENMGFPAFSRTRIQYLPSGERLFDDCLENLEKAEKSIFLSFFILKQGELWDRFYPLLAEKVKSGVEVRLLLDDAGTMFNISRDFIRNLRDCGIQVSIFNPTHRYLNTLYLNYRNHQKFIIIDSNIGYTGGVNLADEYANYTSPFGYWKDTGVRLEGEGVFGMTTIFLSMWEQTNQTLLDEFDGYLPTVSVESPGFCHVFSDGPANNPENPAEGVIFRLIESAREYIYLTTPYLVTSQAMIDTLCRVARSGVRVVILVPFQLDHWYVFEVTQSQFPVLIDAGVEIYRYSPGMLHAKMIVSDDSEALVSTINLDNRSFYSQYEDGVWFCGSDAVSDVKRDIEEALSVSRRVTREDCDSLHVLRRFLGVLLRLFAPLM